jgi:hypothetical protein
VTVNQVGLNSTQLVIPNLFVRTVVCLIVSRRSTKSIPWITLAIASIPDPCCGIPCLCHWQRYFAPRDRVTKSENMASSGAEWDVREASRRELVMVDGKRQKTSRQKSAEFGGAP